ncbi:MAG: translation initiation factor [Bacteroidia bacterium]
MAKNKSKKVKSKDLSDLGGLVFSTDPGFQPESNDFEDEEVEPGDMLLYVSRDKKGRGGKIATLVEGFEGSENALNDLCKFLKQKCGVGGSAKDWEIIIQGDKKDKVAQLLKDKGYKVKLKGG